jgi:Tfp pilus assembly protein PilN
MSDFSSFLKVIIEIALTLSITLVPIMLFMLVRSRTKGRNGAVLPEEIDQIHARLADMDALQGRLLEVEERLDFAERLLGQRHDPVRLEDVGREARHLTPV